MKSLEIGESGANRGALRAAAAGALPLNSDSEFEPSLRMLGAVVATLTFVWAVLASYTVHAQLPDNALELPGESRLKPALRVLLPEGWAFFTRSPREDRFLPFTRNRGGVWVYAHAGPHAEPRNAFGLNRISRAQGVEIGLLQGSIRVSAWQPCGEEVTVCLERAPGAALVPNVSPSPTLCGTVGLALQEPLPWAWSAARNEVTMPSKVVRLDVTC